MLIRSKARRNLLASACALAAQACTPLGAFNVVAGRRPGVEALARDVAYGAGPRRTLDVYARRGLRDAPVLVFFYGGGWESGRKADYAFAARAFASRGFVVMVPDYRLIGEAAYPAFLEDCAASVAWTARHAQAYGGDPRRIVLVGHSAGAYNAAMVALDQRWLAQAGAPGAVKAWAGLAGPYDFLPLSPGPGLRAFGGVADPAETQPIGYVAAGDPPAFLAAGGKDKLVDPRNTTRLAGRLRQAGVVVRERIYPGASHAGLVLALAQPPGSSLPVLEEASDFLLAAVDRQARAG